MIKATLLCLFLESMLLALSPVHEKISSFIGSDVYEKNRAFVEMIFKDESAYHRNGRVDVVAIAQTLRDNGLLGLFFDSPTSIKLTFRTNGPPLFFVKLMGDTLRDLGYYRYVTEYSKNDAEGFVWTVALVSEYATDPTAMQRELRKRGCDIADIRRSDAYEWHYDIDMQEARLEVQQIGAGAQVELKSVLSPHWLDVSTVKTLVLTSLRSNQWHPYITFYDRKMRLLKIYQRDEKTWQIKIQLPRDCVYAKIGDLYHLKNIKEGLQIQALGEK